MAVVSGTYLRYDAKGLREDLSDVIYNISPEDVPFTSSIGMGPRAKQTLVEWQTDSLEAPDGANAVIEGDDTSFTTPAATVRVGNYTQISKKSLILSGTLEVVDKAGRRSELAYQITKRGRELKRDLETIYLQNQAGDAGSSSVARKLASMGAWLKTNVDLAGDGGNPTYTSGVPSAQRTDGTQRAFTETLLKNVIQSVWTAGGNPQVLMVGPFNKTVVSGFAGVVTRNYNLSNVDPRPTAVIAAVDVYVSDFGTVRVIPNRFQRERDAWILDWEFITSRHLRPMFVESLAKTGDADKRHMLVEQTLQVKQEAALGLVADLTTS
jgi:hypothetical protein